MKPIIIFDSGIGGLSILQHICSDDTLNNEQIVYIADQKHFPYGNKPNSFIRERLTKLMSWFNTLNPKLIVIACNTATTISINEIRKISRSEVVGVEPVIKPLSSFKSSLLLATTATTESKRTMDLINAYNKNGNVIKLYGSSSLATEIENMNQDGIHKTLEQIKQKHAGATAIGLSCTHYPLIKREIESIFKSATIIDPSEAVFKHTKSKLHSINSTTTNNHTPKTTKPKITWITTGDPDKLKRQLRHYMNIDVQVQTYTKLD